MPKVVSQKSILANRQNAVASTGPITPAGKAAVSQNALRHGLDSKALVTPRECLNEFTAFRDAYYAEFQPQTTFEQGCIDRMVAARWRARRAWSYEVAALEHVADVVTHNSSRLYLPNPDKIDKLIRYECMIERHFTRAYNQLLQHRQLHSATQANSFCPPPTPSSHAVTQTPPAEKQKLPEQSDVKPAL